jgi:FMN phosphatase YigB (HAD superfamily)
VFFEKALLQANCTAEEVVYMGDTWDTDVLGGMGAGILTYWYRREQPMRDHESAHFGGVVDDLMAFVQL